MENKEFSKREEREKINKLVRVLKNKVPTLTREDLAQIVNKVNINKQYTIKVVDIESIFKTIAVNEHFKNTISVGGIDWEEETISSITVALGDVKPGAYVKIGDYENTEPTEINSSEKVLAIIKNKRNFGYEDLSIPENEDSIYLYISK